GANQTFTITPNTGYQIASVLVDGINQGVITTYPFTNVTANHTISASFAPILTLDTTPPTTTITAPVNGATVSGTITVSVTATDPIVTGQTTSGVREVTLVIDNTALATDSTSPYSFIWDTTAVTNGSHTLFATAEDNAGNQTTVSITVNVNNPTPDSIAPTVSITSPLTNTTVAKRSTVTITANATDNVAVTQVRFYVKGALKCTDATAPYTCAWKVGGKAGVTYRLDAQASDAAGRIGYSTPVTVTGQ
ncbi:MAG: Ig-like domain-containing protein, partial [Candidatus Vogelbacteria bacterium]